MAQLADGREDYSGKCYISHAACEADARAVADLIEARFPGLNGKVGEITRIHEFIPFYGELAIVEIKDDGFYKIAVDFLELAAPETEEIPEEKNITREEFKDACRLVFSALTVLLTRKVFDECEND